VVTSKTGVKRYATSLIFLNGGTIVSLFAISQQPIFNIQCAFLREIHGVITKKNKDLSLYSTEFYISLIFHHLHFNPSLNKIIEVVKFDPIKRYSAFIKYYNGPETGIGISNLSFQKLLTKIKPLHIFEILRLLLLERKLIFIQNDDSDLAIIIESILRLLYPLYFSHY